jgi:hypothetical protein
MASKETCRHCGKGWNQHHTERGGPRCFEAPVEWDPEFTMGPTREELAEQVRTLREVLEVIAAPLHINGDDHAAAVKHARAVLATTETEKP